MAKTSAPQSPMAITAANFCDLEENPIALAMLGTIGVFLAAQYFSARLLLKLRGSPFLRESQVCDKLGALIQNCDFGTRI